MINTIFWKYNPFTRRVQKYKTDGDFVYPAENQSPRYYEYNILTEQEEKEERRKRHG